MSDMHCPGQDSRFWKPEDTFEAACGRCGQALEFFKDDAARRCIRCGTRVRNPRITLGCAQWCEYAKECLGYDPKGSGTAGGKESALVDRLVEAARAKLGDDPERFCRAIRTLECAQELLRKEPGRPDVVLAAALLHGAGAPEDLRRILKGAGMDESTAEDVVNTLGGGADTPESRLVRDAVTRSASAPEGGPPRSPTGPPSPR